MKKTNEEVLNDIRKTSEKKFLQECLESLSGEVKTRVEHEIVFWWTSGIAVPWGLIKKQCAKESKQLRCKNDLKHGSKEI
ncbi:hypothetical protein DMB45_00355 [Sanguibacteroides justesenii]|uniref:hypothetical protein n=1 Tax=Sanguibacteroides justesenii TaxID=1547597 RepID=UPI000D8E341E|nr:hypothetical protein [Sanguibacteroides justesenii]PXZ44935.1 hypothetical protein DMB45_00355 [Sanguibacteroides justesenii]